MQEVTANPTKKLTRVPFKVSRLMEFCTRRELVNQTGHDVYEWALVVQKEILRTISGLRNPRRFRGCEFSKSTSV